MTTSPAPNPKTYNVHEKDGWGESPVTAREHRYTARLARHTSSEGHWNGNNVGGTVGWSNIGVNYYYDILLMKIGVKDLQVFTAPKENGLPVKVALDKVYNYSTSIGDMGSKKINVSLYQGSRRLDTHQYAARNVPSNLTFRIPSSYTNSKGNGTHLPYTVKFEGYSRNDFDVIPNEANLTTDGYTSAKSSLLFNVNSNSTHADSHAYVVRTETSANGRYRNTKTNETFKYSATPLAKNKSGYGDSTNVNFDYTNALGSNYQYGYRYDKNNKLTFSISNKFKKSGDTANLWSEKPSVYGTSGNNVTVQMDKASSSNFTNGYNQSDKFQFPQVYSEHETGAIHASNPNGKYVNGGHKFYAPIWVDLAKYPLNYNTTRMSVNEVSVDLQDVWNIYAQMFETYDSQTKAANPGVSNAADKYDEILFEPVNATNPFPNGIPAGWSNADIQAVKSEKAFK